MITKKGEVILIAMALYFVARVYSSCSPPISGSYYKITPVKKIYPLGSFVTYSCDAGCKVQGLARVQCVYSKVHGIHGWSSNAPKCLCKLMLYVLISSVKSSSEI